ncbi:MAG: GIY-YIG nuclease family protein [Candidatus Pacebacteria bacterium]|nr:GIY-YIG nuclease family protein [Candidatus Paceibacterota bacterium]MBP9715875.1 GIY-YIG nuclease family protein [Candidatus Paceibacterota bacterium]
MPYFVYILLSKKDHKLYVGCTRDYEERLKYHNQGKVPATRNRRPLEIIHLEKYEIKSEAFNRERFLKTLWSSRFKKKILNEYINKIGHNI